MTDGQRNRTAGRVNALNNDQRD